LPRRRDLVAERVYYTVYREQEKMNEPTVLSFRYTGRKDTQGRHVFEVLGAPPGSEMILEKHALDSILDLAELIRNLTRNAS
jgi:hypothetical protein